jgi:FkbM family methyltransferase
MTDEIVTISTKAGDAQAIIRDPKEHIQSFWRQGLFFEQRLLEYIYWHYKGGVWVDIGSNIGNHSLHFAKFCRPRKVISIEPMQEAADFQLEILALNNVHKRVMIHNLAASNRTGDARLVPWEKNPAYYLTCYTLEKGLDVPGVQVPVDTTDNILHGVRGINLIKIDVEMHEELVLEGMLETLKKWKPALFFEFRQPGALDRCRARLAEFGYRQVGTYFQGAHVWEFIAKG